MKKYSNKTIWIVAIIAAVLIGFYLYNYQGTPGSETAVDKLSAYVKNVVGGGGSGGSGTGFGSEGVSTSGEDRGSNGWFDKASGQCWTTPTALKGGTKELYVCCGDAEGYQVDCQGTARLSDKPVWDMSLYTGTYAIFFPSGGTSTPNKYVIAPTVTLTNTQNIDFSSAWIESFSWTSSPSQTAGNTAMNAASNPTAAPIVGWNSAFAGPLTVAAGTDHTQVFPMGSIDLQALSPSKTTPVVYTSALVAKGAYIAGTTLTNYTSPVKAFSFTVTKEEVGFDVTISW